VTKVALISQIVPRRLVNPLPPENPNRRRVSQCRGSDFRFDYTFNSVKLKWGAKLDPL